MSKSERDKVWDVFSKYIRLKYADWRGNESCVTCGIVKHWKEMQAGHFIAGRGNSILFDVRGVHPQCGRCNVYLKGNVVEYFRFMQKKYGDKVIDDLRVLRLKERKWKPKELADMKEHYKELINNLE